MTRPTSLSVRQARADVLRQALERHGGAPPSINQLADRFPWGAALDVAVRDLERAGVAAVELGRVRLLESAGKEGR